MLDDTAHGRFRADLTAIVGADAVAQDRFGIAVSGGPDSMALALLTHELLGERALAATVNHGLRSEAADEARWVGAALSACSMQHWILRGEVEPGASVQAHARTLRYRLLQRWCDDNAIDWLLTAHHADDQLETLLMRLNRGSGVSGMAGVRARNGRIVRPLLGWRRQELSRIVADAAIVPIDDPSNDDIRFDRVRMRQALDGADWLDPQAASVTAAAMGDADSALAWACEHIVAAWPETMGVALFDAGYPREIRRRLALRQLALVDPALNPRGSAIERVLDGLDSGQSAMIGDWRFVPAHSGSDNLRRWDIIAAPPRKSAVSMREDGNGNLSNPDETLS